jgi:type II secretory pathway component PulL
MNNINLFESAQGGNNIKQRFGGGKAFIIPVMLLVGVFIVLGLLKWYSSSLDSQKTNLVQENESELATLSGKNVDRVVDFEKRMEKASKESSSRAEYSKYLEELESLMVSGVRVNSFMYSSDAAKIELAVDNFQAAARQALSFKNSNDFKNLKIKSTSRSEDGKIVVNLEK